MMKPGDLRRFSDNVSVPSAVSCPFLVVSTYYVMSVERVDILMNGETHTNWLSSFVEKNSEALDETG